ncbi:metal-sensing transcriptional repressor [Hymenobacter sp. BT188]|uniref:metal-sensing transcriptional repressor n=1 Tax=Hymenobacter TaxID=89966 RepID=UPI001058E165|nr:MULTISPECIES: metal-sensing transcriptional repressor [Hymenobacter]MBC6609166.1 metal-sensing transcriptional repressor [Hymenobacter sp. BT188]QIL78181.1 metal-sensing transcriptional repressor [Hymenobacter sp. HDW8]
MLPKDLTRDLKSRLNMLAGQLHGIVKMLDAEATEPEQILVQFKAVTNGLGSAEHLLLDEVFRKSLALQLVDVVSACPGNCQDAGRIEELRQQFPNLTNAELTQKMQELREIGGRLEQHNSKGEKKTGSNA